MGKELRTAVIGVGNMGRHHARNNFEIDGIKLVAISDLNEDLGKKMAHDYSCKYYDNFKEMLDKEVVDAVTVAAPSKFHYEIGLAVLNSGKHLLMEKPIAMNEKEARGLIDLAKNKDLKLMVGHIERFNPGVLALKKIVDEGRLGKITSVIARRVGIMPPQIRDANVLVDLGVHDIDIISYILNAEPDRIVANGGRALLEHREDYAEIFLNYGDISGIVQVNWITPVRIRNLSITGTKGYAEVNYLTQKVTIYKSSYDKDVDDFGEFLIRFSEPDVEDMEVDKKEPLRAEIESFRDAIINNSRVATTGEEGLAALRVALAAGNDIDRNNNSRVPNG